MPDNALKSPFPLFEKSSLLAVLVMPLAPLVDRSHNDKDASGNQKIDKPYKRCPENYRQVDRDRYHGDDAQDKPQSETPDE